MGFNAEAYWVYSKIANQQVSNPMSGHVQGLRFEAIVAALEWYDEAGRISDKDEVLERILAIDDEVCKITNARIEAERAASKDK